MRTDYRQAITESEAELRRRERELRGQAGQVRVRMLLLLRSGTATSLPKCSPLVGYSLRQLTRWWARYRESGLEGLLADKPRRGKVSKLTPEAYEGLEGEMRAGRVATLKDARRYLSERWGIEYKSLGGLWWTLHKRRAKPKTGRRRHRQADLKAQEAFKRGLR
jgi:transposase